MGQKHPMNVFRKNKRSGHPAYVYHQNGNYYEYIGITHNPTGNIPLNVNPEPGNDSKAYVKPQPEIVRRKNLVDPLPNWKFDESDKETIEKIKKKEPKKNGK